MSIKKKREFENNCCQIGAMLKITRNIKYAVKNQIFKENYNENKFLRKIAHLSFLTYLNFLSFMMENKRSNGWLPIYNRKEVDSLNNFVE